MNCDQQHMLPLQFQWYNMVFVELKLGSSLCVPHCLMQRFLIKAGETFLAIRRLLLGNLRITPAQSPYQSPTKETLQL